MGRAWSLGIAVALVAMPLASAGWSVKGAYEPDTAQDVAGGWMWKDADVTQGVRKVYLNGFFGQCTAPCYPPYSSFNPNVATVRTGAWSTTMISYALFGVYKDCNRDGYVGLGDQGLIEYRSELLTDRALCKPTPIVLNPVTGRPYKDWIPPHNDGQWVRELLPFAGDEYQAAIGADSNPFNLNATGALAWMDFGLPGAPHDGADCFINPQPVGTLRSTGGLIRYMDCHMNWQITAAWNGAAPDNTPAGPLSFKDKPRDHANSSSRLNQKNPWGADSDKSYVEAWDCSKPKAASHKIDNDSAYNVSAPRVPPTVDASGSPSGTMNSTFSGFDECKRTTTNDDAGILFGAILGGRFHAGHYFANAPYSPGYLVGEGGTVHLHKDYTAEMSPRSSNRPTAPLSLALGRGTPPDLGARLVAEDGFWSGGIIYSGNLYADPVAGKANGVMHVTYYAQVPASAISLYQLQFPKGTAQGVYGAEACGAGIVAGAPDKVGWACDPTLWPGAVKVGQTYRLRDIDCYDSSAKALRDAGAHWGRATGTACAAAP